MFQVTDVNIFVCNTLDVYTLLCQQLRNNHWKKIIIFKKGCFELLTLIELILQDFHTKVKYLGDIGIITAVSEMPRKSHLICTCEVSQYEMHTKYMCISHTNSCTICSRHRCLAVCLKWCSYQDEFLIPFVSLRIHSKSTLIMGDASKIKYPTSLTANNIRTLQS